MSLLEEALAIDETYVDAWLAKSTAHYFRAAISPEPVASDDYSHSTDAAYRALELASDDGRVQLSLARSLGQQREWLEADRRFQRALELGFSPGAVGAQHGNHLISVGHFEAARGAYESALSDDPMNATAASFLMQAHGRLGNDLERLRLYERGASLYSAWPDRADDILIRLAEGDAASLRTQMPIVSGIVPLADSPSLGLDALREIYSDPQRHKAITLMLMSAWAAYFDDPATALAYLRDSVAIQPLVMQRVWYRAFDSVRAEPGFEALLADLGLPEYWDESGWPAVCERFAEGSFDCR